LGLALYIQITVEKLEDNNCVEEKKHSIRTVKFGRLPNGNEAKLYHLYI